MQKSILLTPIRRCNSFSQKQKTSRYRTARYTLGRGTSCISSALTAAHAPQKNFMRSAEKEPLIQLIASLPTVLSAEMKRYLYFQNCLNFQIPKYTRWEKRLPFVEDIYVLCNRHFLQSIVFGVAPNLSLHAHRRFKRHYHHVSDAL